MSETNKIISLPQRQGDGAKLLVQLSVAELRQLIRDEIGKNAGAGAEDRLVDIEQAAKILSVSVEWLYRHRKSLPFAKKIGRKLLKFSVAGMNKWIAARVA